MASAGRTLEEQLVEAGNRLLQPPSSVDELLRLLDHVDNILSRVEQSPSKSMQAALSASKKALVSDELLRHQDVDVKVAVASCVSEITRITAPDAPYDDDLMKEVFQLIVSSFENIWDKSSRSYNKRTLILETVAKVRSCVVMLDLECDGLILEMFQYFLKAIRDYHPENVFSSMETIMTLVLEESEDIPFELISPILASVKKDNEDVLPIAQKLGERVLENCAEKLKPCLIQAKKSLVFSLDDYSEVIASICNGSSGAVGTNDNNDCREPVDENKLAVTSPEEAAQVTKESMTETRSEGDHPAFDSSSKSVVSNGVAKTQDEDRLGDRESSKEEPAYQAEQSVETSVKDQAEPDDPEGGKLVKSESESEQTSKKRGRKPNSLLNSTDPSDLPRNVNKEESEEMSDRQRVHNDEIPGSPSKEMDVEVALHSESEKVATQLSSPKTLESEPMHVTSPSPSGSVPEEALPGKAGGPPKKDNLVEEVEPSADVISENASEKKAPAGSTADKTPAMTDTSNNEGGTTSDSVNIESEQANVASPSPSGSIPDEVRSKKAGRRKKKDNLIEEVEPSADVVSKQASVRKSDSDVKPQRRSEKKAPAESAAEKTPALTDMSKNEGGPTIDLMKVENEPTNVASPSPSGSVPDEGHLKKVGRRKKKENLVKEVEPSADVSKKASDGASDSKVKPQRRSEKKAPAGSTAEKASALTDRFKNEGRTASDLMNVESDLKDIASPSPSGSDPDEHRPIKARRSKKKNNLVKEVEAPAEVVSKKASEGTSDHEVKPQRRSGKKAPAEGPADKTPAPKDKSKNEGVATSDSEAKLLKQSGRKVDAKDLDGSSSKDDEGRKRRGRGKASQEKDVMKSSAKDDDKEAASPVKHASKSVKGDRRLDETSKTTSKRKRMQEKESEPDDLEYGDSWVGSKVKVWWPKDKMFYEGVIDSFDPIKKRHKVIYTDGDEEVLNLKKERWEFIGGNSLSDGEQATECQSSDSSHDTHTMKKVKTKSEPSAKQEKIESSRGGEASSRKLKGSITKSGHKSGSDFKSNSNVRKNISKSGGKSEDDGGSKSKDRSQKSSLKSVDASRLGGKSKDHDRSTPRTSSKPKLDITQTAANDTPKTSAKDTPKGATKDGRITPSKAKGKASNSGDKSADHGSEEENSPEIAKVPSNVRGKLAGSSKGNDSKSGKKRKRGAKR